MPNGAWATTEWVPILVKSSLALGVLPDRDNVRCLYLKKLKWSPYFFYFVACLMDHNGRSRTMHC